MTTEKEWRDIDYEIYLGRKGVSTGSSHENAEEVRRYEQEQIRKAADNEIFRNLHKPYESPPRDAPIDNLPIDPYAGVPVPSGSSRSDTSQVSDTPIWQIILGILVILVGLVHLLDFLAKLTAEDWVLAGLYVVLITIVVSVIVVSVLGIKRFFQSEPGKIVIQFINIATLGFTMFMLIKWALSD